jgi:photosystem II stability/assembly factor-like uncharacterized protein
MIGMLKRNVLLGLLVLLSVAQLSYAQSTLDNSSIQSNEQLLEAKLLPDNEGWVRTKSRIFWTKDAGLSWTNISPQPSTTSIHSVFFLNNLKGWAIKSVNPREMFSDSFLEIVQTDDGGKTWKDNPIHNLGDDFASLFGGDASLDFVDETHGWMLLRQASSSNFSRGRIFVTDDGGENWNELPSPPIFSQLQFINRNDGWLAGGPSGEELYVTNNGGKKWSRLNLKVSLENQLSVTYSLPKFWNERIGILPVTFAEKDKVVVKFFETTNGGGKWKLKKSLVLPENSDNFKKAIFSLVEPATIIVASPLNNSLYFKDANNQFNNISIDLLHDESILAMEFQNKEFGWILTNQGVCKGFKTDCSQNTRLLRVDGGGDLKDISPVINKISEIPIMNPLSDIVTVSNSKGFDKCAAATVNQMQTWWTNSPYFDANIYIGGISRSCAQANLNASWVTQSFAQGWKLIPTWVGPQAPCSSFANRISSDAPTARSQGISEANSATNAATQLGLSPQTIIYYDLEQYNTTTSCSAAVNAFLDGWTQRLHQLGNISGVYGSPINAAGDWINIPTPPDAVWIAKWDDRVTVFGLSPLSDAFWNNNQRIHQYHGGHDETYGGVLFNIDNNISGGPVAGSGSGGTTLAPPVLVAPGTVTAPGSSISTLTPIFQWQSVSGADGYALYVSKFNGSTYDLVFNSETVVGQPLIGTSYVLPAGILVNGSQYRWNMSSHNNLGYGSPNTDRNYFNVSLTNCTYSINPSSGNFSALGGSSTATVTTSTGCTWTASSNSSWISITSGSNGTGNGTVAFSVQANTGVVRTGIITIAGLSYTVNQVAGSVTPSISIDDISLNEGNSGANNFVLNVNLSQQSNQTITVNYTTSDGTANSGTDYQFRSGTLTFLPNDTTEAIFIPVNGDTQVEPNETFFVNLSNPTNATFADSQGLATIINDDSVPSISIGDISFNEGNSGVNSFPLNVNLSQPSNQTITVNYTTSDGTANSGTDYQFTSGTLTFLPNDTTEAIFIPVNGDTQVEPNETFFVNLSNPTNATLGDSQGLGTIINDDSVCTPPYLINPISQNFPANGGNGTVQVTAPSGCAWTAVSNSFVGFGNNIFASNIFNLARDYNLSGLLQSSLGKILPANNGERTAITESNVVATPAFTEGFDNIGTLPGSGWFFQNNSVPVGTTGWFQGGTTFSAQS